MEDLKPGDLCYWSTHGYDHKSLYVIDKIENGLTYYWVRYARRENTFYYRNSERNTIQTKLKEDEDGHFKKVDEKIIDPKILAKAREIL